MDAQAREALTEQWIRENEEWSTMIFGFPRDEVVSDFVGEEGLRKEKQRQADIIERCRRRWPDHFDGEGRRIR